MSKKLTYEYVKNFIKKEGYILLSDSYVNNKTKLDILCPLCNNISKISYHDFNTGGVRCSNKKCINERIGSSKRHSFDYVKKYFKKRGYTLLSKEYKEAHTKLDVICGKGHHWSVTFGHFKNSGIRCNKCWYESSSSKGEREVSQFVKKCGYNIIENDRTQIVNPLTGYNLELDVWIPSIKKAIEYNGIYWHSFIDRQIKDRIKKEQCEKLGIKLLIIKEENWQNNQQKELEKVEQWLLK